MKRCVFISIAANTKKVFRLYALFPRAPSHNYTRPEPRVYVYYGRPVGSDALYALYIRIRVRVRGADVDGRHCNLRMRNNAGTASYYELLRMSCAPALWWTQAEWSQLCYLLYIYLCIAVLQFWGVIRNTYTHEEWQSKRIKWHIQCARNDTHHIHTHSYAHIHTTYWYFSTYYIHIHHSYTLLNIIVMAFILYLVLTEVCGD